MDIHGSPGLIGPIAPIIGAVVGALITAAIAFFVLAKRKRVVFFINDSEDLTLPLRHQSQNHTIIFTIDGQSVLNFNRTIIHVRNAGNTPIENFKFDVELDGTHNFLIVDPVTKLRELREAISVSDHVVGAANKFSVTAPFFNPKERFSLYVLFDNATDDCSVRCRLPDVNVRIRRPDPPDSKIAMWKWVLAGVGLAIGLMIGLGPSIFKSP